jgi:L-threonylcarbamoyladenylate synthase
MQAISEISTQQIAAAAHLLRNGGLVAFPTETVYGLGANALATPACIKIFEAKGRPLSDPLIVHLAHASDLVAKLLRTNIVGTLGSQTQYRVDLVTRAFWPGPLTLLLPRGTAVSPVITAGSDFVAIRVPDHAVAQALLKQADVPVAAPSANRFGRISPTTAEHVRQELGERVDMILDGGPCTVGVESTILDVTQSPPRILRLGGVAREDIEHALGEQVAVHNRSARNEHKGELAPGMMDKHYAPASRLRIAATFAELIAWLAPEHGSTRQKGVLLHSGQTLPVEARARTFDIGRDFTSMAKNLYAGMRALDAAHVDEILVVAVPAQGLGAAIADRLMRASA